MKIFPDAKVQTLADCHPGQLVRGYEYAEGGSFGIVFDFDDGGTTQRGVVSLTKKGPEHDVDPEPDSSKVLAYSGELVFEPDHLKHFEGQGSNLYHHKGVIVVHAKDGWTLNVQREEQFGRRGQLAQLQIPSGKLLFGRDQARGIGFFGSWSAYLVEDGRPTEGNMQVATFTVKGDV